MGDDQEKLLRCLGGGGGGVVVLPSAGGLLNVVVVIVVGCLGFTKKNDGTINLERKTKEAKNKQPLFNEETFIVATYS